MAPPNENPNIINIDDEDEEEATTTVVTTTTTTVTTLFHPLPQEHQPFPMQEPYATPTQYPSTYAPLSTYTSALPYPYCHTMPLPIHHTLPPSHQPLLDLTQQNPLPITCDLMVGSSNQDDQEVVSSLVAGKKRRSTKERKNDRPRMIDQGTEVAASLVAGEKRMTSTPKFAGDQTGEGMELVARMTQFLSKTLKDEMNLTTSVLKANTRTLKIITSINDIKGKGLLQDEDLDGTEKNANISSILGKGKAKEENCMICSIEVANSLSLPCRHVTLCTTCIENRFNCPSCSVPIYAHLVIEFA